LHAELFICDWSKREDNFKLLHKHIYKQISEGVTPSCQPFHALIYPLDSIDKLILARKYAERDINNALQGGKYKPYDKFDLHRLKGVLDKSRIRLGYVSYDFRNHPLAHLMQSVFGMHDRSKFEIFCFSLSESDNSSYRARIEADSEHFFDISKVISHAEAAEFIHSLGIDVLINLSGYTKGGRNEIFALKPAPIQISYMGFCSTMGAKYIDYMGADKTVIPEMYTNIYEEKIIWLPHSYFVNDYAQSMRFVLDEAKRPKRADYGLPEDKFIFANFNQIYKIDPDTFNVWMSILKKVPNSILWLLRFPVEGQENIVKEAAKRGVAADKLFFTNVEDKPIHVNRCFLADLCLDTPLCNGHTTGCDILWSGLPMVTMPLRDLASRVGAGLCVALECPEMIKSNYADYEEFTVEMALGNPGTVAELAKLPKRIAEGKGSLKLKKLRYKIEQKRITAPLFNTKLWVRNWEKGIKEAVRLATEDKSPCNIDVTKL
jgi:protein O-GlcNAc transferase